MNLLTQKNLHQFPPKSWSYNLPDNVNKSSRRRRRRREGSQRKKGQLRREIHKGKELYNRNRADDTQEGHSVQKMNLETERFLWECWLWKHPLIYFSSLKCFLHKAQTPNTWRIRHIYQLKMKGRALESWINYFFSCEPPIWRCINLFPFCYVLGKLSMKYKASLV